MNKVADNRFEQALEKGTTVLLDGGLATEIQAQGHNIDSKLWSAKMLVRNPQAIIDAHRAFLDVGAECIISASYQASHKTLMEKGFSVADADQLIISSVELAREARQQFLDENHAVNYLPIIAASIGPYGASMYNGAEYTGDYDRDADGIREFHHGRLTVLDDCGADVLAVETIPNATEARVLCEMLHDCRTPAWVSFCCRDSQHLSDGTPLRVSAALFARHPRVAALGVNCTSPEFVTDLIGEISNVAPSKAIVVYPNSGEIFEAKTNTWQSHT